jgi:heme A synthase
MSIARFTKYSWGVLAYNLFVILFGAYVRASQSGDGCGGHWPLCNGEVIPPSPQFATIVEFTHRLTSGLSVLLIVGLFLFAYRLYPKGNRVRLAASLSLLFIFTEALVGAGLVLFNWVAGNASMGRAISTAVHLVNTFLLLAVLTLTALWSSDRNLLRHSNAGWLLWSLGIGLLGMITLGASGALTALGDTLFPVSSLSQGLQQDFSPTANFMIRLRIFHPTIAISVSIYLVILANFLMVRYQVVPVQNYARALIGLIVLQVCAGFINVYLLAPIWLQLVHLFISDLVWIVLVLLSVSSLSQPASNVKTVQTATASS